MSTVPTSHGVPPQIDRPGPLSRLPETHRLVLAAVGVCIIAWAAAAIRCWIPTPLWCWKSAGGNWWASD